MNRLLGIFCLLLLMLPSGISQKKNVQLSEAKLAKNQELFIKLLHSDTSGYYLEFLSNGRIFSNEYIPIIKKYDKKFNEIYRKEYKLNQNNVRNIGMKYIKGKIAWLFYKEDRNTNRIDVYICEIGLDGIAKTPKVFSSFEYINREDIPKFSWSISRDTTSLLFVAEMDKDKKRKDYSSFICVLDHNLELLWQKKVEMNYSQKSIRTSSWGISNNNAVYFIGKVYDNEREKESKKSRDGYHLKVPSYKTMLFKILEQEKDLVAIELNIAKSFSRGVIIQSDQESNLIVAGLFADTPKGPILGPYIAKIDGVNNSVLYLNKRMFSKEEIESFGDKITKRERKTKHYGLDGSFEMMDLLVLNDGSSRIIIEENYNSEILNQRNTFVKHYHSNHIIVTEVGKNGDIGYISIIPKRQSFKYMIGHTSYSWMQTEDNVYYLYNDNDTNFRKNVTDPDKYRKLSTPRKAVAVLAHFENGVLIKKELFDRKTTDSVLLAMYSKQINDNEFLFFTWEELHYGKGKFGLGTVQINE